MWTDIHMPLTPEAELRLFGAKGQNRTFLRKKLAALNDQRQIGLPPEFFGYRADGQANDRGETTTGIGTYAGGLRFVATGSRACELLQDKAPRIHSALINETNSLIPMHVRSGEHGLEFLPYERQMAIRSLCVGHARKGDYWYGAAESAHKGADWLGLLERKVPNYLTQCLMKQGVLLAQNGDDCPGGLEPLIIKALPIKSTWSEAHSELKAKLGIKLLSVAGHTWMKRERGNALVVLKDVEFSIRANLIGPWFAGRMKIEARGELINATRQTNLTRATASEVAA